MQHKGHGRETGSSGQTGGGAGVKVGGIEGVGWGVLSCMPATELCVTRTCETYTTCSRDVMLLGIGG